MSSSFVDQCLAGTANPDEIDAWVEAWHENAPGSEDKTLYEYLGFTHEEARVWARHGSRLGEILEGRKAAQRPA